MKVIAPLTFCVTFLILKSMGWGSGNYQCSVEPTLHAYTELYCSNDGCEIKCVDDYKFPHGETKLELFCLNNRVWVASGYSQIPECSPVCNPPCMNGGVCYGTNQCMCSGNFGGPRCENQVIRCPSQITIPQNTMGKCTSGGIQTCKVTCVEGYRFPDGSLTADLKCVNGRWTMFPRTFTKCEPVCSPSCLHMGKCIGHNLCKCTDQYRGPQCQYDKEVCNPRKVGFGGKYRCLGNSEKLVCEISCPEGYHFKYPPYTTNYTCNYSQGFYTPQEIPVCEND